MAFLSIPLPIVQLSLAAVLKCGQSFRWSVLTPVDSITPVEYRLCLKDRVVCLRQSSDTLFYRSVYPDPQPSLHDYARREAETLAWLRDYFQLDIDLVALYKQWAERDPVFAKLQERFEGIRMLRQDPWENLISFVLPLYPCASLVHNFFDPGLYALLITIYHALQRWFKASATNIHLLCSPYRTHSVLQKSTLTIHFHRRRLYVAQALA
jgi:8-oxoguanine DNA glycosylase, N-terminal domain